MILAGGGTSVPPHPTVCPAGLHKQKGPVHQDRAFS